MRNSNYNIKEEDYAWCIGQLIDISRNHQVALTGQEETMNKLVKSVRRQSRRTRTNTVLSAVAISYVFLSARTMLYLDRRVNKLNSAFISGMDRRGERDRDRTEGK